MRTRSLHLLWDTRSSRGNSGGVQGEKSRYDVSTQRCGPVHSMFHRLSSMIWLTTVIPAINATVALEPRRTVIV